VSNGWFCPKCRAALPGDESTPACPACAADFGPHAAWGPVLNNEGVWSPRPQPPVEQYPSLSHAISLLILRLMLGASVFLGLVVLMFLSAVPYGGGGKGIIGLMKFVVVVVPLWAATPLIATVFRKVGAARRASARQSSVSGKSKEKGR
jgi:uncharacterized membrane protein